MFKVMLEGNATQDSELYELKDDKDRKLFAVNIAINTSEDNVIFIRATKRYLTKIAEKLYDKVRTGQRLLVIGNFDIITKEVETGKGKNITKKTYTNNVVYASHIYII